jgi:L-threonylcarbamoyladenylate synthase
MRALRLFHVDPQRPESSAIEAAAEALRAGRLVVFPTETFYGIAADARSETACRLVFELKGRPTDKALPCIASEVSQVERFVGPLSEPARRLARRFWPGPLSLVLDAAPGVAAAAADGTIAVRVSGLALARRLAEELGGLVTATSANRAGDAPAATVAEVAASLGDVQVDLVLDGGPSPGGKPSTLVDVRSGTATCLREGAVAMEAVRKALADPSFP